MMNGDVVFFQKKSAWETLPAEERDAVFNFCDEYIEFISANKTEREFIDSVVREAEAAALKDANGDIRIDPAVDRDLYVAYDGKAAGIFHIGDVENVRNGFLLIAGHVDSPRLDLKQNPLYVDSGTNLAMFRTHYYGGIKKYQFATIPLALHGVVTLPGGAKRKVVLGEDEDDGCFFVGDLLPHLDPMNRKARSIIKGEELVIVIGSIPYEFKDKSKDVKLNIMRLLNEKYGITEKDLQCSELEVVPAGRARHIGLDKSMIGGYGQDDRACSYCGLRSIMDVIKENPKRNLGMVFLDKEEIGNIGNTGASSNILFRMVRDVLRHYGVDNALDVFSAIENSSCLSSDVDAGINPMFKSVHEESNASKIGYGVSISKFGAKDDSNDAHAEFVRRLLDLFDQEKVSYQISQFGAVDVGGGGTIANTFSLLGMQVIDIGTPVLNMHSPFEVSSKVDVYSTHKAYKAFYMHF